MNFDSKEELYFSWMLEELEEAGYINSWGQCKTYPLGEKIVNKYIEQLKTKSKDKEQTILNGCEYTPDFQINWNSERAYNIFFDWYKSISKINTDLILAETDGMTTTSIIEIKPNFDQNNMTRLNGINRKWVYQKYGIFVNLVKIPDIFKDTFVPIKFLKTDSGRQDRVINFPIHSLQQYINKIKPNENNVRFSEGGKTIS